jgi:hypothetical protein
MFDGSDDTCSICAEAFVHGEQVCRLVCRHVFHAGCWDNYLTATNRLNGTRADCPNCRGAGTLVAVWPFIGEHMITQEIFRLNGQIMQTPNQLGQLGTGILHTGLLFGPNAAQTQDFDIASPRETGGAAGSNTPPVVPNVHQEIPWNNFLSPEVAAAEPDQGPAHDQMDDDEPDTGAYAHVEHEDDDGSHSTEVAPLFHVQTRLADGRPSLLIDPGSVGNLSGDLWAKGVAQAAARRGYVPSYERRPRPLKVSGVGQGTQACNYDCKLPVAFKQLNGSTVSMGHITTPTVQGSELPGLLGLTALRKNRAILDFQKMELYFCGPGDYDLTSGLPPGTDGFQLEVAPSGHLVLPCCEYESGTVSEDHSLTLVTQESRHGRRVPPPPTRPPVLPPVAFENLHLAPPPGLRTV